MGNLPLHGQHQTCPTYNVAFFPMRQQRRVRQSRATSSPSQRHKNKKLALVATFLRLGIASERQDADQRCKTADGQPRGSQSPFYRGEKESPIAKKLQNAQIFVFAIENRRNEQTPAAHRPLASHDNAALRHEQAASGPWTNSATLRAGGARPTGG